MHLLEPAASGRAKCRGCGKTIAKGELRFGERVPNPFVEEGDMALWFHLPCGAFKRPEPLLEALGAAVATVERKEWLTAQARRGLAHRRLPRIDGAQRAPSGRATCRSCREAIRKGAWRIRLVFFEQGRFEPSGYIHPRCAKGYFETDDVLARVRHFSTLSEAELAEVGRQLRAESPPDETP